MKLLVVSLKKASETKYISPRNVASYMLGKTIREYPMFLVDEDNNFIRLNIETTEVIEIQRIIKAAIVMRQDKNL